MTYEDGWIWENFFFVLKWQVAAGDAEDFRRRPGDWQRAVQLDDNRPGDGKPVAQRKLGVGEFTVDIPLPVRAPGKHESRSVGAAQKLPAMAG